ncbi:hypothetical protein ABZ553_06450 [Streptomyces sparsogenes]|uniref:phage tail protein n=1 Tax=Streptomyces sparsogenes TaxID=67365 RepID=UPI0033CDFEAB
MKAAPEKGGKATKPATKDGNATPTQRTPETAAPPERTPGLTPRHLQRLQGMAGNAAVSRLVAQRYTAPVKPPPSQAPGFRRVQSDVAAKKQKLSQHNPAADESKSAQDAAVAPPDDKEAQGKAANAEKMNDAKPGEFDKAAFIEAVNKAIADQAPKNLDEADKFSDSGKAEKIKGEVDGKVTDGKNASSKDIETTTKAAPDTSQAKEKEVTPMKPDQPPANPGAPNAADATPQQQPPEVTDFSEGPKKTDQQMADADVTEEQLAKSNEPEFTDALSEKKKAEQHSATAPNQARATEKEHLATAKSNAAAAGTQAMASLTATRNAAGKQVDGGKGETKSKDEQKRQEVTAKLQKVFDATQKDVETILSGLDGKVDKQFEDGEKKARDAFNTDQKRRMKAYKKKRYGGFFGPAKWAKDKLMGMPQEANQLFQESRKLYVNMMQGVISSIADTIGTELGKAKARIAQGRADIKTEVDKLPADLKQYGQEAAKDFAGKFDDLESEVNDKSQQLVQTLAQKYTQALNAVDEEIKKLQEANKGLVQKAVDAVVGVIKTINELKNLLMGILAKAAGAITKIIKDPIGFLGNLVRAVGAGLQQFISNIGTHLQTGLVSWLLGTSAKAGIEIPAKFDLKGIIQLIASLLGLTWANIRARITRKGVPDQAMSAAEQSVPVAKALATEGPAGAAKEITAETGDLKSTILDDLKSYLIPTVIIAGITWILSLLNPASAFVRAVKGIIDIVSFVVNQGAQIVEFVNAVLDAVVAIANGGSAGVPKMVETALATSIPLLIGLLASLLGIGGLANKIKQVFQKVSRPVNRAIDKIATKIAQAARRLWGKLKGDFRNKKPGQPGPGQGKDSEEKADWWHLKEVFRAPDGESHTLTFRGEGRSATLVIRSNEKEYKSYLDTIDIPNDDSERKAAKTAAAGILERIEAIEASNIGDARKKPQIASLLRQLVTATIKLIGDSQGLPESTPPIYGALNSGGFATSMTVAVLTEKGPEGSQPDDSLTNPAWSILVTRYEKPSSSRRFYAMGHLLNHTMHGPGDTWSNLAPQSYSGNGLFAKGAEKKVKRLVNEQGKGVEYAVTLTFGTRPNKQEIIHKWEQAGDPDIEQKKAILDAEDHVPLTYEWRYRVIFENGKFIEDGESDSGSAENKIRQEAGKYHVR